MPERPQNDPEFMPTLQRMLEKGRNATPSGTDRIAALMSGYSIEVTPGQAAKVRDFREALPQGTEVAVTFLPGSDWRDTVATAKRLREEGMEPAPHVAARSIPDAATLDAYLGALADRAGCDRAVALAGAVDKPLGEFTDSMRLLETGAFDRRGFRHLGVAGHPEGNPDVPAADAWAALKWKRDFAARTDMTMDVRTQFLFEAGPLIEWDRQLSEAGVDLPVRVGVPGLATLKTLINHARACGIGASMRFLTKQAKNVSKLMTVNEPDKLVFDLAKHASQTGSGTNVVGLHLYPLGGFPKTAAWANEVATGRFAVNAGGDGFTLAPNAR